MYYFFGAGNNCKGALKLFGKKNVIAIIDNSEAKIGTRYEEIPVISFEEFKQRWKDEKIIITAFLNSNEIEEQLKENGIRNYEVCPFINADVWNETLKYDFLKQYKNIYKGKKCFIIGNGPSLRIEDLDQIESSHIISFGSNRIYEIFNDTKWRPTYCVISDGPLYDRIKQELPEEMIYFVRDFHGKAMQEKNVNWFNAKCEKYYPNYPQFSEDLVEGTYVGRTVTYHMLQIAVYMGFSEIYLLGIDFSYGKHFYVNDQEDNIGKEEERNRDEVKHAYIAARNYAESHGVKIYNATRGGELEVFERVNFDELFNGENRI